MSNPMLNDAELNANFAKIKPKMTQSEARIESSRCLFCHDAPCTIACPTEIDIPMFIRQIMSGNEKGAARTIFSRNILGYSCASVCPTEVLCEGSCVYLDLNERPIDIGRLQAHATEYAIRKTLPFFEKAKSTGKKVVVIGAGPAGLACAHELTRKGHEVVVYEANPKAGGLNMYGVAPYKLSNQEAENEIAYVQSIGFKIKTNYRVVTESCLAPKGYNGKTVLLKTLLSDCDALFLGLGLGSSRRPGIPGEEKQNVIGATEFIYNLREKEQKITVGKKVVVIGAGNTAIDACVESAKFGADVTLLYRRSEAEQSAYHFEVDFARLEGVQFHYLTSPIEIFGKNAVEGVRCVRNKLTAIDKSGKPGIQPIPDTDFLLPCDQVILATGQKKQTSFFESIPDLALEGGNIKINNDYQTTCESIFAGGDCVNGGKEVVNAVAHGRDAAQGIHRYLMKEELD